MQEKIKTCVRIEKIYPTPQFKMIKVLEDRLSKREVILEVIPDRTYTPTAGDKIYFIPGCEVPRFKVKQLCEKYNVALVKYREKANVKFIGPQSIMDMLTDLPHQTYSRDEFLKFLVMTMGNAPAYQDLIAALRSSTSSIVAMNYNESQQLEKGTLGPAWKGVRETPASYYFKSEESYELFISILNDPQLYSQNEILNRINTGGIMGKEEYESIKRMLGSSDQENLKLGMEAMANCDYQQSCIYLLLLIKEFGVQMDNSRTKNHVNFKSLLKFFEIQNLQSYSLNNILQSLLKRKLLNKANLDQLMPMAIEEMKKNSKSEFFRIENLVPSKQIMKGLEENVLDKDPNTEIVEDPQEQLNPKLNLSLNL